jgi:hypothetical protein
VTLFHLKIRSVGPWKEVVPSVLLMIAGVFRDCFRGFFLPLSSHLN